MSLAGRAASLVAAVLMSACAVTPKAVDGLGGDTLSGRLAVRVEAAAGTPEELAAFSKSESETWAKVVKQAGIKAQ